jgi:hypothetical protein
MAVGPLTALVLPVTAGLGVAGAVGRRKLARRPVGGVTIALAAAVGVIGAGAGALGAWWLAPHVFGAERWDRQSYAAVGGAVLGGIGAGALLAGLRRAP